MQDDQLLEKGTQAEQARDYLQSLTQNAVASLTEQLVHLYPDETAKFSAIRSQMMALEDIMGVVEADIAAGKEALARLQGEPAKKEGIL